MNGQAVDTTNGAGSHNIQLFVMDPDGTVLHCLPGYWNAEDLAKELKLAKNIGAVWQNKSMSLEQKKMQFARLHTEHFKTHPKEMTARSHMQGFDKHAELARGKGADTVRLVSAGEECADGSCRNNSMEPPEGVKAEKWSPGDSYLVVKTTDEIMHDRMSKRPFVAYSSFDTGKFSDYGTHFYDKHEDALDENGRMVTEAGEPPPKHDTMRDVLGRVKRTQRGVSGKHEQSASARSFVKTYGQLKSTARNP